MLMKEAAVKQIASLAADHDDLPCAAPKLHIGRRGHNPELLDAVHINRICDCRGSEPVEVVVLSVDSVERNVEGCRARPIEVGATTFNAGLELNKVKGVATHERQFQNLF